MKKRLWVLILGLIVAWIISASIPASAEASNCQFVLGFKTLHDLIPNIVGNCLDNEQYAPSGDGLQDTTGPTGKGGLLVWQKSSNLTSFTDGYHTWILGPNGLQMRLNTQRFPWEPTVSSAPPPQGSAGTEQSRNWAGYAASGGSFTEVRATWTTPSPAAAPVVSGSGTWVGIGGLSSSDLIQAGTSELVAPSGQVHMSAWVETLPLPAQTVPLTVRPGDSITVSIVKQAGQNWSIRLANNTTGQSNQQTLTYASSLSSAEWIEEAPVSGRRLLPLSNFGTIQISRGTTTQDGVQRTIAQAEATPITMIGNLGVVLASPSPLFRDGASFSVTRNTTTLPVPLPSRPSLVPVP